MKSWLNIIPGLLFLLAIVAMYALESSGQLTDFKASLYNAGHWGEVVYVLLLIGAVVLMPITVMPLIPVASALFGPFTTGVLSIIGWTVGGAIAFLIARYLGRPILKHFVSLEKFDEAVEQIPTNGKFFMIVLLRLTMPVDIISYALGFSKAIKFWEYIVATLVGVTWFSFAFAYMGDALYQGKMLVLIEVCAVSVLIFTISAIVIKRKYKRNN